MKREGDEVEKLVQLCVLIGVGIAKVFHFLRNYVGGKKRIICLNITFIVKEHLRSCFC